MAGNSHHLLAKYQVCKFHLHNGTKSNLNQSQFNMLDWAIHRLPTKLLIRRVKYIHLHSPHKIQRCIGKVGLDLDNLKLWDNFPKHLCKNHRCSKPGKWLGQKQ